MPDLVHKAILGDQLAARLHQQDQGIEIAGVEFDRHAVARKPAIGGIEPKRPEVRWTQAQGRPAHFSDCSLFTHAAHLRLRPLMAFRQSGDKSMNTTDNKQTRALLNPWRVLGWGVIAGLISLPAIAMQFTSEVNWGSEDFIFATVMLGGVGLAFELAVRASGSWAYRGGAALALGAGLMLLWANAAVGIVGNEDRLINLWFNLIPLLALFAAVGARFRAGGMAVAMAATATAQILVGIIVQLQGHFTWVFTLVFAGVWLASAWLFRKAASTS